MAEEIGASRSSPRTESKQDPYKGYSTKLYMRRLRPEVQPLNLLFPVSTENVSNVRTFHWIKVPFSHTYFRTTHVFSINPWNDIYDPQSLLKNSPKEILIKVKDFSTVSYILTCRTGIPAILYTWSLYKVLVSGEQPAYQPLSFGSLTLCSLTRPQNPVQQA